MDRNPCIEELVVVLTCRRLVIAFKLALIKGFTLLKFVNCAECRMNVFKVLELAIKCRGCIAKDLVYMDRGQIQDAFEL